MDKIKIIYWSQTGNTEEMAKAIAEGIIATGKESELINVSRAKVEDVISEEVFALGCPAMGAEVLEEYEMEPFVNSIEKNLSGKRVVLFGSYGWGDGEWMRDFEERVKTAGAEIIGGEGIICQDAPDNEILNKCKEIAKIF